MKTISTEFIGEKYSTPKAWIETLDIEGKAVAALLFSTSSRARCYVNDGNGIEFTPSFLGMADIPASLVSHGDLLQWLLHKKYFLPNSTCREELDAGNLDYMFWGLIEGAIEEAIKVIKTRNSIPLEEIEWQIIQRIENLGPDSHGDIVLTINIRDGFVHHFRVGDEQSFLFPKRLAKPIQGPTPSRDNSGPSSYSDCNYGKEGKAKPAKDSPALSEGYRKGRFDIGKR